MKSLEVIQSIFTWYCICPVDKDAFHLVKSLRIVSILIFYIVEIFTILASVAYFSKNFSIDLENALYGFFQVVILMNAMYALTIGLAIRKDIQRIFKEFQICYEKSKSMVILAMFKVTILLNFHLEVEEMTHWPIWRKLMTKWIEPQSSTWNIVLLVFCWTLWLDVSLVFCWAWLLRVALITNTSFIPVDTCKTHKQNLLISH